MKDLINFKGHFKIQAIDKNNTVIDEWEDDNMIMEGARSSMSEIFANLTTNTFINKIKLGTLGHVEDSIITPKATNEGFVKERTKMFSEFDTVADGGTVDTLLLNDMVYYETGDNYYRYIGDTTTNYSIVDGSEFSDIELWSDEGTEPPYYYTLEFTLPGTSSGDEGDEAIYVSEEDSFGLQEENSGAEVFVLHDGTSVSFTFDIATAAANNHLGTSSIFTEASLWANDRIFAMKTFKAKVKDSTVLLRIVWTITF